MARASDRAQAKYQGKRLGKGTSKRKTPGQPPYKQGFTGSQARGTGRSYAAPGSFGESPLNNPYLGRDRNIFVPTKRRKPPGNPAYPPPVQPYVDPNSRMTPVPVKRKMKGNRQTKRYV